MDGHLPPRARSVWLMRAPVTAVPLSPRGWDGPWQTRCSWASAPTQASGRGSRDRPSARSTGPPPPVGHDMVTTRRDNSESPQSSQTPDRRNASTPRDERSLSNGSEKPGPDPKTGVRPLDGGPVFAFPEVGNTPRGEQVRAFDPWSGGRRAAAGVRAAGCSPDPRCPRPAVRMR